MIFKAKAVHKVKGDCRVLRSAAVTDVLVILGSE